MPSFCEVSMNNLSEQETLVMLQMTFLNVHVYITINTYIYIYIYISRDT